MSFYALSALLNGVASTIIGIFVYLRNRRGSVNKSYGLLSLILAFWSYSYFLWQISADYGCALSWIRLLSIGAILIPAFYLYFVLCLLHKNDKKRGAVKLTFFVSIALTPLVFTDLFIKGARAKGSFKFWPDAGNGYALFLLFFFICVIYAAWLMLKVYLKSGEKDRHAREQIKYVIIASIVGFLGGSTNYPLWYNINIAPVGNFLVSLHVVILAYAIVKYNLMDIRLTITRTSIFIGVYTFVLGLPFLFGVFGRNMLTQLWGDNWWLGPLALTVILATAGPFAYIYFQKQAEAILLREQRKYQEILRQTAMGMTRIRDPRQLLNLIVDILIKNVNISHSAVYLADAGHTQFIMRACRNFKKGQADSIGTKKTLIKWLEANKKPLLYDEITHRAEEQAALGPDFKKIEEEMKLLNASVIVPCFLEDKIPGIITLGEKISGKTYTSEDLNIFSVLAGQSALAIENALLYENIERKVKERTRELVEVQKQLVQAEKLATVGTLAGGVAHEINNPLTAILTSVQMLLASGGKIDAEFDRESLELIEEATKRCRTIVQKLMVYARKPIDASNISKVNLLEAVRNTVSFLNYQLAQDNIKISVDAGDSEYLVMGNRNELEQVVTNMFLNAKDAIRQAKSSGNIRITFTKNEKQVRMDITDDGPGIPDNIMHKIFDPFFTTKDVGKGLGLGLSICQSIIEKHSGTISVQSEVNKGTTFSIQLPEISMLNEIKTARKNEVKYA